MYKSVSSHSQRVPVQCNAMQRSSSVTKQREEQEYRTQEWMQQAFSFPRAVPETSFFRERFRQRFQN